MSMSFEVVTFGHAPRRGCWRLVQAGTSLAIFQRDLIIRTGIGPYNIKSANNRCLQSCTLFCIQLDKFTCHPDTSGRQGHDPPALLLSVTYGDAPSKSIYSLFPHNFRPYLSRICNRFFRKRCQLELLGLYLVERQFDMVALFSRL